MTSDELVFPVVCFYQDGAIDVSPSLDNFTRSTAYSIRKRSHNNVLVIDAQGNAYTTLGAKIIGGIGPLNGYFLIFDRLVRVDVIFSDEQINISLDDLKQRLRKSFQEDSSWTASESCVGIEKAVERAKSIPQIVKILAKRIG
jgi:hypothetical protein